MIVPNNLIPTHVCPFGDDCAAPGAVHLYPDDKEIRMLTEQIYIRNVIRVYGPEIFTKGIK
jgi:hypothetical protein